MPVLSEIATMTEVAQGTSLARFGHGELLVMAGKDAAHQKFDGALSFELEQILNDSPCLQAIPPNDPPGWNGFLDKYKRLIEDNKWFGSSFVSRHDWAPWTEEYREVFYGLLERDVLVVAPYRQQHTCSLFKSINTIECPEENAFEKIDIIETEIESLVEKRLVLLSCGPTATVLADRLARKGIWAVDWGNFGKFL